MNATFDLRAAEIRVLAAKARLEELERHPGPLPMTERLERLRLRTFFARYGRSAA